MPAGYISQKLILMFDPSNLEGGLKAVFEDETAKLLWLIFSAYRWPGCPAFESHCIMAAEEIREKGVPRNKKDLAHFIRQHFYFTWNLPRKNALCFS